MGEAKRRKMAGTYPERTSGQTPEERRKRRRGGRGIPRQKHPRGWSTLMQKMGRGNTPFRFYRFQALKDGGYSTTLVRITPKLKNAKRKRRLARRAEQRSAAK